jgi:hypothetical protein
VGAEVHAQADRDDEDAHWGDVDGQAPPVHEAWTTLSPFM